MEAVVKAAAIERVTAIKRITDVENIRSVGYRSHQETKQFPQLLESRRKMEKQQQEKVQTQRTASDDFIQYVIYDMKACANWEERNQFDISG